GDILWAQPEFLDSQFDSQLGDTSKTGDRNPFPLEIGRRSNVLVNHNPVRYQVVGSGYDDSVRPLKFCLNRSRSRGVGDLGFVSTLALHARRTSGDHDYFAVKSFFLKKPRLLRHPDWNVVTRSASVTDPERLRIAKLRHRKHHEK